MSSDGISIPSRLFIKELNILKVYQTNILQHLLFMFKVKNSKTPRVFNQAFTLIDYTYIQQDFLIKALKCVIQFKVDVLQLVLEVQQYAINFLRKVKSVIRIDEFKNKIKGKILNFSNEFLFF